ncbi:MULTISPECIES: lecithin retinol acyltransferase family protein [Acinetobacter]|uniref:lecithin retinol acyltransferase family protein n=1 Tax=Acinetobacter TaxID=469 RepID=UPI0002D0421C|nr:lecithin retinol acyltransferase family protein [Acinetobacter sp. CIP 102136]ENX21431.1 hypothetical protein F893_01711 [Acinetobacter sp. CIP 102136]
MGLFDFISDACSTIADAACSITDAVGEVASTTVDIVSDAASSTVEVIGDLAGSAVDTVGDVTSSTIDFVSNTASTALDFAVENPLTTIATVTGATIAGSTGLVTSAAVIATKTTAVTTPTVMGLVGLHTAKNAGEYVIDLIKGKVTPVRGSVVYCDLTAGRKLAEHSGIYIGDNRIVHLNRHGYIEIISPQQFISGITTGNEIYVSCEGEWPVGCDEVADFAESMVGIIRNYHVLVDNCHQFSAGCLMKDPENYNNFLWFLKDEANKRLGADNWRLWDKNYW